MSRRSTLALDMEGAVSNDTLDGLREELRTLTVEQLAGVMGIEEWRVYEMLKRARNDPTAAPPYLRVGKLYRFPIAGLRKWFAEQTKACSTKESRAMQGDPAEARLFSQESVANGGSEN